MYPRATDRLVIDVALVHLLQCTPSFPSDSAVLKLWRRPLPGFRSSCCCNAVLRLLHRELCPISNLASFHFNVMVWSSSVFATCRHIRHGTCHFLQKCTIWQCPSNSDRSGHLCSSVLPLQKKNFSSYNVEHLLMLTQGSGTIAEEMITDTDRK